MIDPTEIAADEAVIAKMTPGDWIHEPDSCTIYALGDDGYNRLYLNADLVVKGKRHSPEAREELAGTLDGIAAARTRWPLYVAEVKRLKTPVKVSRVNFCASLDSNRGLCACGDFVNGWQKFCPSCGVPLMWEEK